MHPVLHQRVIVGRATFYRWSRCRCHCQLLRPLLLRPLLLRPLLLLLRMQRLEGTQLLRLVVAHTDELFGGDPVGGGGLERR